MPSLWGTWSLIPEAEEAFELDPASARSDTGQPSHVIIQNYKRTGKDQLYCPVKCKYTRNHN